MTKDPGPPLPSPHGSRAAPASIIAIDGPVASGKTAVGLRLARALRYRLVDTGMIYRAVAWLALQHDVAVEDEPAIVALAESARIELGQPAADGGPTISVDGRDITGELRSPEVDRSVSFVSRLPGVRRAVLELQRSLAREGNIIMLGRDIGTVVLPEAAVKIYLDASAAERARRRHLELREAGVERAPEAIRRELEERDEMDSQRHVSPLRPAADAIIIDTDALGLEEVLALVEAVVAP